MPRPGNGETAALGPRDERWIVDLLSRHSVALMATARRNSRCAEDAQDAYQRGLEILTRSAGRLRRETALGWLHVVIRNEARALAAERISRAGIPVDADDGLLAAVQSESAEERALGLDDAARATEALGRLKPDERRALLLRAFGLSYAEIADQTGWSKTKVNRCLAEGRSAFLDRFAGIQAGEECARWQPTLSAIADGEAGSQDLLEVRPHVRNCPACRATLKELSQTDRSLSLLLPVGMLVAAARGSSMAERLAPLTPSLEPAVAAGGTAALGSVATKLAATVAVVGASITISAPEPGAVRAAEVSERPATAEAGLAHRPEPQPARPRMRQAARKSHERDEQPATPGGVTAADRIASQAAREFVPPRAPQPSLPPRNPQQDEFTP